jgi:hypothetical protein
VLRDKGLGGEEVVVREDEVFEFICYCCAATAGDVNTNLLNGIVIIIATANTMAVASNRFLIGVTVDNSSNLFLCMKIYGFFKIIAADLTVLQEYRLNTVNLSKSPSSLSIYTQMVVFT